VVAGPDQAPTLPPTGRAPRTPVGISRSVSWYETTQSSPAPAAAPSESNTGRDQLGVGGVAVDRSEARGETPL
jgi:hypothetical protein